MIDTLALAISHGLLMLTAFLLLKRPDLDSDVPAPLPPSRKDRKGA